MLKNINWKIYFSILTGGFVIVYYCSFLFWGNSIVDGIKAIFWNIVFWGYTR